MPWLSFFDKTTNKDFFLFYLNEGTSKLPEHSQILLNFGENSEIGSKIGNKIGKIGSASSYAYALF